MTMRPDIRISPDAGWADATAILLRELGRQAIRLRGRFLLALSGGSTPQRLYQALAQPAKSQTEMDWHRTVFLFGDERCVSPDHPDSNYGMARASLFAPLDIPPGHVHRMSGENPDPRAAADEYERSLRTVVGCTEPEIPSLDLVLLGLGEDGHTASLFPGTTTLLESHRLVTVGRSPKGIPLRLTLTLGVINRASVILFLVTGSTKAQIVRRILAPQTAADRALPAALVTPEPGHLIWMLDQAAASELPSHNKPT
ncbi:6-phosphogluconolactonase [Nitrospira japonica]|uniref:6-phosphogluconolactonase n=1 Tax=Nitrospira japonica TaxID=1325564 RepID=A0A1W1I3K0_9BACT|nr:6-phosphogluconolactonase [Nitrospira japonica]SLM47572.1 6-phosphogluconolactonase [Nitrospira japonica]